VLKSLLSITKLHLLSRINYSNFFKTLKTSSYSVKWTLHCSTLIIGDTGAALKFYLSFVWSRSVMVTLVPFEDMQPTNRM